MSQGKETVNALIGLMTVVLNHSVWEGPDQSETPIKVKEAFSPKLFSVSESLLDPLEATFGSQVKNPCIVSMFSNKKTETDLMMGRRWEGGALTSDFLC